MKNKEIIKKQINYFNNHLQLERKKFHYFLLSMFINKNKKQLPNSKYLADTYSNLAVSYHNQFDHYDANIYYDKAMTIYR
jgi:hypothetical protein